MSHVGGFAAEQCSSPVDGWRPRHTALRGNRYEERSRGYNGGASYQF
jgi:hypothetical protein